MTAPGRSDGDPEPRSLQPTPHGCAVLQLPNASSSSWRPISLVRAFIDLADLGVAPSARSGVHS